MPGNFVHTLSIFSNDLIMLTLLSTNNIDLLSNLFVLRIELASFEEILGIEKSLI
ncbi:hypothetical protein FACS189459_4480 [Bacilli bacterium]|nr:hypothetical protein FACS189459_4480 [Bacilli bacterium]